MLGSRLMGSEGLRSFTCWGGKHSKEQSKGQIGKSSAKRPRQSGRYMVLGKRPE